MRQFFPRCLSDRATTMPELMMAIAIFTVITLAVFVSFMVGNNSWQLNSVQIELQQELRKATTWLTRELRQSGVWYDIDGISVDDDGAVDASITFRVSNSVDNATGLIIWSDAITYSIGGANLDQIIRQDSVDTSIIANRIDTLEFTRSATEANVVSVHIVVEGNTATGRTITMETVFDVRLRN
ncbi:PilW family protein [Candidatus Omnitrophota bacterium]